MPRKPKTERRQTGTMQNFTHDTVSRACETLSTEQLLRASATHDLALVALIRRVSVAQ